MHAALARALEARLGQRIVHHATLAGGDINRAFTVQLGDGRELFVKTHDSPLPAMYACEASGLAWLAQARALRVPEVVLASDGEDGMPACLVLEYIRGGRKRASFDEELGRGLSALHRHGAAHFGLDHDNYIAVLPQPNARTATWAEFYAERRIRPQLELARRKQRLSPALALRLDELCARMPELTGPEEAPARLHGDLWNGNLIVDERGAPCLIDPAVYAGHREVDLAMMRLFGGFGARVFAAYAESYPLAAGHAARIPLYQLYPLLVHVNLFGGHYTSSLERALEQVEHCA